MTVYQFRGSDCVELPIDTKILFPAPLNNDKQKIHNIPIRVELASLNTTDLNHSSAVDRYIDESEILSQFLAVSLSKGTYIALPIKYLEVFKLLLTGNSIESSLPKLNGDYQEQINGMTEILTHISMRNFYANADTAEYVPDGEVLHFYVTNLCNLRCNHCYMSSGDPLPQGELTTPNRIKVIEDFANLYPKGRITFTGGEALASPDIFELLTKAKELGLTTKLYSNGILITPTNIEKIVRLVNTLQISLDGATESVNDLIRGKGSFKKAIRAIKLANSYVSNNFKVRVAVTLMPINFEDIENNLENLMSDLSLDDSCDLSIGSSSKLGRATNDLRYFSSIEEMRSAEARIVHKLAKKGVYKLPLFSQNNFQRTCGHGGAITISADGNIYPCSITEQPSLGNARSLNSRELMASVAGFIDGTNVDKVNGCNRCDIRYFCAGICRITNYNHTGSYYDSGCTTDYKSSQIRNLIRKYQSYRIVAEGIPNEPTSTVSQVSAG